MGIISLVYKFIKFNVRNPKRIILDIILALVICLLVIPYFKEYFKWSDGLSFLVTWFSQQGTSKFMAKVESFVNLKSKL